MFNKNSLNNSRDYINKDNKLYGLFNNNFITVKNENNYVKIADAECNLEHPKVLNQI